MHVTETKAGLMTAGQIEDAHGLSPGAVDDWCRKHGLPALPGPVAAEGGGEASAVRSHLRRRLSAAEVAQLFGWRPETPRERWFAEADVQERALPGGRAGRRNTAGTWRR